MEDLTSITVLNRRLPQGIPFEWHHHPEYELTLTLNSRGQRLVGDHVGEYEDGDVVLVGPNLPHTWCSASCVDPQQPHVAIVAWFADAWASEVVALMPELSRVGAMLKEARRGVHFSRAASAEVRPLIESLPAKETREYVEKVMAGYWIYRRQFGQPTPSLEAIAGGVKRVSINYDRSHPARTVEQAQLVPAAVATHAAATVAAP